MALPSWPVAALPHCAVAAISCAIRLPRARTKCAPRSSGGAVEKPPKYFRRHVHARRDRRS